MYINIVKMDHQSRNWRYRASSGLVLDDQRNGMGGRGRGFRWGTKERERTVNRSS